MEPKQIQDIAAAKPAEPKTDPVTSGEPEVVSAIPVRAPDGQTVAVSNQDPGIAIDPSVSAEKKLQVDGDVNKPKIPSTKSQPTAAIITACLALVLLAAGAYLKFFANS